MGWFPRRSMYAVLMVAGASALSAAQAQTQSPFAPIETPSYDPDLLKAPPPAPGQDSGKPGFDKSANPAPKSALPKIGVGGGELRLDANRTRDVVAPGVNIDSGETSNLSTTMPAQKQDQVLPDYFGLKLSVPTR